MSPQIWESVGPAVVSARVVMTEATLLTALNTIGQCAAALAAFLGFLGLLRLDRLQDAVNKVERVLAGYIRSTPLNERFGMSSESREQYRQYMSEDFLSATGQAVLRAWQITTQPEPELDPLTKALIIPVYRHWAALMAEQRQLIDQLAVFIAVTLVTLALAIVGFVHVNRLATWAWTPCLLYGASALLVIIPGWVMVQVAIDMARSTRMRGGLPIPDVANGEPSRGRGGRPDAGS
jgi:hypothetical protein